MNSIDWRSCWAVLYLEISCLEDLRGSTSEPAVLCFFLLCWRSLDPTPRGPLGPGLRIYALELFFLIVSWPIVFSIIIAFLLLSNFAPLMFKIVYVSSAKKTLSSYSELYGLLLLLFSSIIISSFSKFDELEFTLSNCIF